MSNWLRAARDVVFKPPIGSAVAKYDTREALGALAKNEIEIKGVAEQFDASLAGVLKCAASYIDLEKQHLALLDKVEKGGKGAEQARLDAVIVWRQMGELGEEGVQLLSHTASLLETVGTLIESVAEIRGIQDGAIKIGKLKQKYGLTAKQSSLETDRDDFYEMIGRDSKAPQGERSEAVLTQAERAAQIEQALS